MLRAILNSRRLIYNYKWIINYKVERISNRKLEPFFEEEEPVQESDEDKFDEFGKVNEEEVE